MFMATFIGLSIVVYGIAEVWERSSPLEIIGPDGHEVSEFTFTGQENQPVHSVDHDGKIWLVNCFFTSCPIVCPKVMRNLQEAHNYLRNDENIVTMSFTVDPKRDTPEKLLEYAARYNANNKSWFMMTGEKGELYKHLRRSFLLGASDAGGNEEDFIHSETIVVVDPDHRIRATINGTADKAYREVLDAVKSLKKEFNLK